MKLGIEATKKRLSRGALDESGDSPECQAPKSHQQQKQNATTTKQQQPTSAPIVVKRGKQRQTQKGAKAPSPESSASGFNPSSTTTTNATTTTKTRINLPTQLQQQHSFSNLNLGKKRPLINKKEEEEREIKRLKALRELLVTERSYVNDLEILRDVYLQPLATVLPTTKGVNGSGGNGFSVSTIISAVTTLLGVNKALLGSLEVRVSPYISDEIINERNGIGLVSSSPSSPSCYHPSSPTTCLSSSHSSSPTSSPISVATNLPATSQHSAPSSLPSSLTIHSSTPPSPSSIPLLSSTSELVVGDIILKMADFLKVYITFPTAQASLTAAINDAKSEEVKEVLDMAQQRPEVKLQPLGSFLIKPVQRICRYPLLLHEILASTAEWHTDHEALTAAVEKIKLVAAQVDVQEKINQAHNRIMEINDSLIGKAGMELLIPTRQFQMEGDFVRIRREERKLVTLWRRMPCHVFLFSDILLCNLSSEHFPSVKIPGYHSSHKPLYILQCSFTITQMVVKDLPDCEEYKNAIAFEEYEKRLQKRWILMTNTYKEKYKWMKKLKKHQILNFVDKQTILNEMAKGDQSKTKGKKGEKKRDKIEKCETEGTKEESKEEEEEIKKLKKKLAEMREEIDVQKQRTFKLEWKLGQLRDEYTVSKENLQEILDSAPPPLLSPKNRARQQEQLLQQQQQQKQQPQNEQQQQQTEEKTQQPLPQQQQQTQPLQQQPQPQQQQQQKTKKGRSSSLGSDSFLSKWGSRLMGPRRATGGSGDSKK